jgi:anti-repressor protein
MNNFTSYNHTAPQGKNKATRIKGRGFFVQSEVIPQSPQQTSVVTMSSLEFAVLTGKRHDYLATDIYNMLDEQGLNVSDFLETYEVEGDTYSYFNLPQDEVYNLLTGYSIPLRAKVIDRWYELEAEAMNLSQALNDVPTLQRLLSIYTERVLELEDKVSDDVEKVEFYDDMASTDELFNTGVVAKTLGTGKTKFLNYLRKHKILMGSGNKRNLPYQRHLDAGRLEVKWIKGTDRKTGERFHKPVPLFTGKGILWIKQFVEQNGRWGL